MPFVKARLLDAFSEKQTGVVDQNIEPAPSRDRSADRAFPVFFAGNIQVVKDRRRVPATDLAGGFPCVFA